MALIKTDPSQTKTVIALIGILVVTLGVTVVRLKPAEPPRPAQQQVSKSVEDGSVPRVTTERVWDTSRNPFERPPGFAVRSASEVTPFVPTVVRGETKLPLLLVKEGQGEVGANPTHSSNGGRFNSPLIAKDESGSVSHPASLESNRAPKAYSESSSTPEPIPAKPRFTLLATANVGRAFSAVIRVGDSEERIVQVGDVLEGGFRVIALDADRAVLTNGREIIVAKRPR